MSEPSQADIFAALQAQSSGSFKRAKVETTTLCAHPDPPSSLTTAGPSNSRKLYCWREGCGSLILLPQTGDWMTAEADLIPAEPGSPFKPTSAKSAGYWHIKGGPMAFENIGYSRPSTVSLPPQAPGVELGKKVKWLICAECDLGPIGWSFEGGEESWLSADRVRYGA